MRKERLATEALEFLGYPSQHYRNRFVGQNTNWFDCSGFVRFLLKRLHFPIGNLRHVNEFFDSLGVFIHPECVSKGDLVFFSWDGGVPRHIGIMCSRNTYIHAPGVTNSVVKKVVLRETDIRCSSKKQIYFRNPIGFKRLAIQKGRYKMVLI